MKNDEAISAFLDCVQEIQDSGFILIEKKIRNLLSCVAYYDVLKDTVKICQDGFDYEAEFSDAVTSTGEVFTLRLPSGAKKKVALVLCFLMDFDEGKIEIGEFVNTFFHSGDGKDDFAEFIAKIIFPFKDAFIELLLNNGEEKLVSNAAEREIDFAGAGLENEMQNIIENISNIIAGMHINDATREEIMNVLVGFKVAVSMRDAVLIKAFWSGIKTILKGQKSCAAELEKADKLIALYIVSK